MAKLGILVGFGAGYVLGARAGRQRYDQLVEKAQDFWADPRVQRKASQAQDVVQEKATQAAGVVQEKASHAASAAQDTVKDKVSGRAKDSSDTVGTGVTAAPGAVATPAPPSR